MRQPYPSYRYSGVEWLGDVPEHWQDAQVRRWFTIVNGGTPASGIASYWNGETVWLTPDDLGRNSAAWISESRRKITDDGVCNSSARVSPEGSIILSTRAPIGHIAITAVPAATNQGCRTLVPNPETHSSFAYYSLIASRSLLQALGKGTTFMELTPTELGGFRMARPPFDEQQAIAAFLDHETAKIDTLISKNRLLLDRLAEYRTALITRTVTKGLPPEAAKEAGFDPNPALKPSGVEWIGDVPEHWDVRRLRHICQFAYGDSLPSDARQPGEVLVFGSNGAVGHHDEHNTLAPVIVIGRKGSHGQVNFYDGAAFAIDTTYFVDERYTAADLRWLYFALPCTELADESLDSAVPGLSREHAYGKYLSVPPPAEQQAIAAFLDRETERIDTFCVRPCGDSYRAAAGASGSAGHGGGDRQNRRTKPSTGEDRNPSMTSQTDEKAFETTIESMLINGGWEKGDPSEWDVEQALFPARVVAFLQTTQPTRWQELKDRYSEELEPGIVAQTGERTQPERHAPRVASRVQIPRKEATNGLFQTSQQKQPRSRVTVRVEQVDGDTASAMPSR